MEIEPEILLVEDNKDHAEYTKSELEKSGFKVEIAETGSECFEKLIENDFDLILLDYRLPEMDGLDVLKKIKEDGFDIPIIMVTGLGSEEVAVEAMKLGAYDYIVKSGSLSHIKTMPHLIERAIEKHELKTKLIESEQKISFLASIVEYSSESFIATDEYGKIFYVNPATEALWGYKSEELTGKDPGMLNAEKNADKIQKEIFDTVNRGEIWHGEILNRKKSGELFYIEATVYRMEDDKGNFMALVGFHKDITERKKAEEELKRRIDDLSTINMISATINKSLNLDETLSGALERVIEVTGADVGRICILDEGGGFCAQIYKEPLQDLSHDIDKVELDKALTGRIIESGKPLLIPDILELENPGAFPELIREGFRSFMVSPLKFEERILGTIEIGSKKPDHFNPKDLQLLISVGNQLSLAIENSKLYENIKEYSEQLEIKVEERTKELILLKEFNEEIVQSMGEGILIKDSEGLITFVNPKLEEMLERPREELIGEHWECIITSDMRNVVDEESDQITQGLRSRYESVMVSGDGNEIPVFISVIPLHRNEIFSGSISVITDITEIKEAEVEARKRSMKYRLEEGNIYLVWEKELDVGLDVYRDCLNCGYRGLILARDHPEDVRDKLDVEAKIIWLAEKKKGEDVLPPELPLIEREIEDFCRRNRIVLLDRLDYLVIHNGFMETIGFIHRLSDLFYLRKSILLISIDPETLDSKELSLLKKETKEVELKIKTRLSEDLQEILNFVYQQNKLGIKPCYADIAKKFSITRITASKRISMLKNERLLMDRKKGRFKVLEITDKGKVLAKF